MKKKSTGYEKSNLRKKSHESTSPNDDYLLIDKSELETVHKELKLKKNEIQNSKFKNELISKRYIKMYDLAQTSYFTLLNSGEIIELNLSAARILGCERKDLIGRCLISFVSADFKPVFEQFIQRIVQNPSKQVCEVSISVENNSPIYVSLSGIASENADQLFITLDDVTEQKQLLEFNNLLITSLPYPAMYVRFSDRVIISANKLATDLGAEVGSYCWKSFGKSKYGTECNNKCSFCKGDDCMSESPCQNTPNLEAFDRIWDAFWIKVNEKVYLHYLIDITERYRIYRERKFLLEAAESINDVITVKDLNLRVLSGNQAFVKAVGRTSIDELIGKTDAEIFGVSPDQEPIRSYMEDERKAHFLKQGEFILKEEPFILSTGEVRTYLTKKYPIFDDNGKLMCTSNVSTDITERKKQEVAIRESEMFIKQTQHIAMLGTYSLDVVNGIWTISEVLGKILGVDYKEHNSIEDWFRLIHPELNISDAFFDELIEDRLNKDEEFKIIRQSDNTERWVHEILELEYDSDGLPIKIIGTIHDITDRKRVDEEKNFLMAAINNSDNRIVVKDLDLKIVAANKAWLLSKGETSIDNIIGKTDAEAFKISEYEEPVHSYMQEDRRAQKLKPGESLLSELPIKFYSGKDTISLIKRFPIFDEKGKIFCTGVIATDITERKKVEEELRRSEMFLKKTQQIAMLGTFNYNIITNTWTGSEILSDILGFNCLEEKSFEDWVSLVNPDTRNLMVNYFFNDVVFAKSKFDKEYQIIRPDNGQEVWVHGVGDLAFDKNNEPIAIIGTIRDITDLKVEQIRIARNLKFIEALLKSVPIPVFFKDVNGVYTGCNQAFTSITGYSSDQIIGKSVKELWPNVQADIYKTKDNELISSEVSQSYESQIIDQNNNIKDVIFSKNVFYDENGSVAGIVGTYIDITDNKRNVEELKRSQLMLQAVLDNFPGTVFWKDMHSTYLGCNKSFAQRAGLKNPLEIVGKTDFDLPWADQNAANYQSADREVIEAGISKMHIIEKIDRNNETLWFDTSKLPLKDVEGNLVGVIGVSNDITERRKIEENLIQSESKFRSLAEFTKDWEYWIDKDQRFIYCSPSCEKITGYSAKDFSNNPGLLDKIVFHDDQIIFLYHKQMQDVGIEVNEELQFRIVRKDGAIRWIGHVCKPMHDEEGNYIGVRVSNRDITKRKETEQQLKISKRKYKLLSQNITDGIFIIKHGKFEYINAGMNAIFGYDYRELEGLVLLDMVLPAYYDKLRSILNLESASNKTLDLELECIKKDGTIILIEMYINYVADEHTIYGVAHDVTEKRQLEKRNMVKAIIQTEEKERALFSKELHDGLGPLLSTIKIYLQWTQRLKNINKRNEIIAKAEEVLEESLTTVKEISNRMSPHLLTNYGLSAAIQSFLSKIEQTNVIKVEFQSNAKRRLDPDIEVALYRVTIECINNTIKYANAQNIFVGINDSGKFIQLQYKDDGIGFDFEKTISERKGLGLFNLQNRIETIGGKINIITGVNKGVEYQITIGLKDTAN